MTKLELAWAAGIIDGEGCISIIRVPASAQDRCVVDRFVLHLKVTMGHKETIDLLHRIFNAGSVQSHQPKTDRTNASYSWICQSRQAQLVLRLSSHYFVTKAKEAKVALEFMKLPLAKRGGWGGSCKTNVELSKKREILYWKLRKLKSRWRFYKEKMKKGDTK